MTVLSEFKNRFDWNEKPQEQRMIPINTTLVQFPLLETSNVKQTKRALSDREASRYIGMSSSWLRHSRIDGVRLNRIAAPPFIKIGRSVRYLIEDLDAWLEQFQKLNHLAQLGSTKWGMINE